MVNCLFTGQAEQFKSLYVKGSVPPLHSHPHFGGLSVLPSPRKIVYFKPVFHLVSILSYVEGGIVLVSAISQ